MLVRFPEGSRRIPAFDKGGRLLWAHALNAAHHFCPVMLDGPIGRLTVQPLESGVGSDPIPRRKGFTKGTKGREECRSVDLAVRYHPQILRLGAKSSLPLGPRPARRRKVPSLDKPRLDSLDEHQTSPCSVSSEILQIPSNQLSLPDEIHPTASALLLRSVFVGQKWPDLQRHWSLQPSKSDSSIQTSSYVTEGEKRNVR